MTKNDSLLAIDPSYAGKTGYALFKDGKLAGYGELPSAKVRQWIERKTLLEKASTLAIEDQFLSINPKTYAKLVSAKMMWIVPAKDLYNMDIREVSPQEWQKHLTRGWKFGKGSKKDERALREYVQHRWRLIGWVIPPDALCAICIGTFALDTNI